MAASFKIFTGHPKAFSKLNPTHPRPRLCGSRKGCPLIIGPGYPSEIQSYFQSAVAFFTSFTIFPGVIVGPDGYFRGSFSPVAKSFTFVPPTSITSTRGLFPAVEVFFSFMDSALMGISRALEDFSAFAVFITAPEPLELCSNLAQSQTNSRLNSRFHEENSRRELPRKRLVKEDRGRRQSDLGDFVGAGLAPPGDRDGLG